jgi:hypothetical protein
MGFVLATRIIVGLIIMLVSKFLGGKSEQEFPI